MVSSIFVFLYVNIPIKKIEGPRHKRVDYLGALNLVMFLMLFLLALNTGGTLVPWTHPLVLIALSLSVVFLAGFIYTEKFIAKEPVIPLKSLQDRTVLASCLTMLFMVMSVYCVVSLSSSIPLQEHRLTADSTSSSPSTPCSAAPPPPQQE